MFDIPLLVIYFFNGSKEHPLKSNERTHVYI